MFSYDTFTYALLRVLDGALSIYSFLILIRALISWFSPNPYNQLYILLIRLTEPVLAPLRRVIPSMGVDISPLVAILLIDFVIRRLLLALFSGII